MKYEYLYEFTEYELEKMDRIINRIVAVLTEIEKLEKEVRFLRIKDAYNKLGEGYRKIYDALSILQKVKSMFR